MRAFAYIIVEQLHGHWTAWFSDTPHVAFGGEWPADAIRRLLEAFGDNQFDTDHIDSVDDASTIDHLEFRIPYRDRRRIPVPSQN